MNEFHRKKWTSGKIVERFAVLLVGQGHILQQMDGKTPLVQVGTALSQAFALCAASDEATAIRDYLAFFQTLRSVLNKEIVALARRGSS